MNQQRILPKKLTSLYGIADGGYTLFTSMEAYFFSAFLTDYSVLSLKTTGILLGVVGTIDFFIGLMCSYIIYKADFKWGKYRSWFLFAAVISPLTFWCAYTSVKSAAVTFVLISIGYLSAHFFPSIGQVANMSFLIILTDDIKEKNRLSARRSRFITASSLIFALFGSKLIAVFGKLTGNPSLGYTLTAFMVSVVMSACFFIAFCVTKGYDYVKKDDSASVVPMGKLFAMILRNRPLRVIVVADILRNMCGFMANGFAYYFYRYSLNRLDLLPLHMIMGAIGSFIGANLDPLVAKIFPEAKKRFVFYCFCQAGCFLSARLVYKSVYVFIALFLVNFIFQGAVFTPHALLYANTADYSMRVYGEDISSAVMGLTKIPMKLGMIFKGVMIPIILSLLGVVAGASVSSEVGRAIAGIYTLVPAVALCVSGGVIALWY